MKMFLKLALAGSAAISLPACNTIRAIAIAGALPAAAAANARVGANCIRATERGERASAVPIFDLMQAQDVVDAQITPLLPTIQVDALGRIRARTRGVCPTPPPPLPPIETAPDSDPMAPVRAFIAGETSPD